MKKGRFREEKSERLQNLKADIKFYEIKEEERQEEKKKAMKDRKKRKK
jgi:hypothetical protein